MSKLYKQSFILILSQNITYLVQLLIPIILLRLVSVEEFGRFKEFLIYSNLFAVIISFSLKNNILYFISADRNNTIKYISNTAILLILFTLFGIACIILGKGIIINNTSFNFITYLALFVVFNINLEFIEFYWIATEKVKNVIIYNLIFATLKIISLWFGAYYFNDVTMLIKIIVYLEILRFLFQLFYLLNQKLLKFHIYTDVIKNQFVYALPLGFASIVGILNNDIGKLFITSALGSGALAIYAVGSQKIPILGILKNAVGLAIFPEMVSRISKDPKEGLLLWQRANTVYFAITLPIFFILFIYAEQIISLLYTGNLIVAVPIFRIFLVLLLRQCFEMTSTIKAMNKNKIFLGIVFFTLLLNIVLIKIFINLWGMIGPAVAFILTDFIAAILIGRIVIKIYQINLARLFLWRQISKIIIVGVLPLPILFLGFLKIFNNFYSLIPLFILYLILYFLLLLKYKLAEVENILLFFKFKRK